MLALRQVGYALLVPFGENTRYDLVIDDGVRLARVQCKTGRLREGAIRFASCSTYAHHRTQSCFAATTSVKSIFWRLSPRDRGRLPRAHCRSQRAPARQPAGRVRAERPVERSAARGALRDCELRP
ncbi:MAG: hypothetical protein H0V45_12245 [Actinobacteria bacterium]|nr:hypothetical protein [Actinomycetota bacterium]